MKTHNFVVSLVVVAWLGANAAFIFLADGEEAEHAAWGALVWSLILLTLITAAVAACIGAWYAAKIWRDMKARDRIQEEDLDRLDAIARHHEQCAEDRNSNAAILRGPKHAEWAKVLRRIADYE